MESRGIDDFIEAAFTQDHWRELAPGLTIEGPPARPLVAVDHEVRCELWNALLTDGYFTLGPQVPQSLTSALVRAIERLRERRLPPVFAFAYDEAWHLGGWFQPLLDAALGPGFRMMPDFWAWYVQPSQMAGGWGPHRDKRNDTILPSGMPMSLSCWIPLTDATPLNGCIYVLPASCDPIFKVRGNENTVHNVQDIRALPARAGSFLCWNQNLLHWGGRSSEQTKDPRVSLSIEFQRADVPAMNEPLLDALAPPSFVQRLSLIAQQIFQYEHMYTVPEHVVEIAHRIVAKVDPTAKLRASR